MSKISVIINADTRPENYNECGLGKGVVSRDFISDGVYNKIKFFDGFDKEIILFIDKHEEIPQDTLEYLNKICDTIVVRRHTNEDKFNDYNYISALSLARGDIIVHFDQDSSAFASSKEAVQKMIDLLDNHDFVSYPSHWSPLPVVDNSFDHVWCSTRFFMCKKESLDLGEIKKCLVDYDYWLSKYPVARACHWVEHLIGSIAKYRNQSVYYPPINFDDLIIFSWGSYDKYTLRRLNEQPYEDVRNWVTQKGGIRYPNDIFVQ